MGSNKKIPITQLLLWFLEKGVEGAELALGSMADLRQELRRGVYHIYPRQEIKQPSLSQAIRRLRERGLVELERRRTGELIFHLTESGRDLVHLNWGSGEWDGRWRIVIFDIPEGKRVVRDLLRWKLKQWGFTCWQKSVWATKKSVTRELRQIVKDLGIEQWVLVIESGDVGKIGRLQKINDRK